MTGAGPPRWFVLGFTADDVVACGQDARLASACAEALATAGRPLGFELYQGSGEGEHLIYWYASEAAAALLDRQGIDWRRFIVEERGAVPAGASRVMEPRAPARRPGR